MIALEDVRLHEVDVTHAILFDGPESVESLFGVLVLRDVSTHFSEDSNQVVHVVEVHRLVDGEPYPPLRIVVAVDTHRFCDVAQPLLPVRVVITRYLERIEELRVLLVEAVCLEHLAEVHGFAVNTFCYLAYTFCAVVNAIHTCHHGRECFGGADIRCGALTFYMLFTRLQGKAVSRALVFIFAQTDDTSRHVTLVFITRSHIAGGRSTEAHRQSETLCCAAHDVGVERLEERESHQVRHYRHFESRRMTVIDESFVVLDGTVCVRPLHECTEEVRRGLKISVTAGDNLYVLSFCTRAQYR